MCTTPHNPNNVDLSRDVLFQLTTQEVCQVNVERIDQNVWKPLNEAIRILKEIESDAIKKFGEINVITDQLIRLKALHCWFMTQRNVASWIANVHGYLKSENGVHRLVRLSPFNTKHTRETSFALIEILPEIDTSKSLNIDEKDLRVDTYRAIGHGGQSVNTTDSAVRITHVPTGLTAQCQNERSQLQNKEHALKILHAKLQQLMQEQAAEKLDDLKGGRKEIKWGSQIRSYVLHPYTMVKDHRTKYETSKVEEVLDGDIEGCIRSYLEQNFEAPKADLS
jgi:protein subunit release factor B